MERAESEEMAAGERASTSKTLSVVSYPGVVKNLDKALKNLGGLDRITADLRGGRGLSLSHYPDDLFHRPTFSQKNVLDDQSLVLVVSATRKKGQVSTRILGLVSLIHEFRGMADFQYLPVKTRDDHGDLLAEPVDLCSQIFPTDISSALNWFEKGNRTAEELGKEAPLHLPPFVFSRFLNPTPYIMCRDTEHRDEAARLKKQRADVVGLSVRAPRKTHRVMVLHDDAFPQAPTQDAVTDADIRCRSVHVNELFRNLFTERPMWVKQAILFKTKLSIDVVKNVIGKFAFYINSGPWGRLWCKFGYDPRSYPDAVQYQTIVVSFRHHEKIAHRNRIRLSARGKIFTGREPVKNGTEASWVFRAGVIPETRQIWYSICDVHLPEAQHHLAAALARPPAPSPQVPVADRFSGWLSQGALDIVRLKIVEEVNRTSAEEDEEGFEALLDGEMEGESDAGGDNQTDF